jgi:hypothetical protein
MINNNHLNHKQDHDLLRPPNPRRHPDNQPSELQVWMNDVLRDPTADFVMSRFDTTLRLMECGIIDIPPAKADIGVYIISDSSLKELPLHSPPVKRITLAKLFDS